MYKELTGTNGPDGFVGNYSKDKYHGGG